MECPISSIEFNVADTSKYNKTLELDTNVKMSFNRAERDTQNYPITLFTINQGNYICKEDYKIPALSPARSSYALLTETA